MNQKSTFATKTAQDLGGLLLDRHHMKYMTFKCSRSCFMCVFDRGLSSTLCCASQASQNTRSIFSPVRARRKIRKSLYARDSLKGSRSRSIHTTALALVSGLFADRVNFLLAVVPFFFVSSLVFAEKQSAHSFSSLTCTNCDAIPTKFRRCC